MTSSVPSLSGDDIKSILRKVKTIAIVGASANPERPSYEVAAFLLSRGYEVTAVNPGLAGQSLLGAPAVASLKDLPAPVDMVDIFRNSAAAGEVVTDILALNWRPSVIWMQLGVVNEPAAALARAQGITVIMNRCPKIDYVQLGVGRN
ncbi:CoA-binding domain protein [Methylocella silvestris BL2]|uniref:CoA-binding domain protein n=1 Tax=Methylocella silvestris (strain DSM 15510 / CIP 108128 / LMG 27833 / NCIMB 13906 / BL2) TaxID=395965 RepID=B8ENN4_METSB|nr:CoA-binding domain protein [Methylocella silvestris BL2]